MAQFDVFRGPLPGELWLDCQADSFSHLTHRFVVPLAELHDAPKPVGRRLNPTLKVGDVTYLMLTQFSGAVPIRDLGECLGNLEAASYDILRAIDTLTGTA